MGEGGDLFRSTDNGDTWTEQDNGFAALDVNAVAIKWKVHSSAGFLIETLSNNQSLLFCATKHDGVLAQAQGLGRSLPTS